MVIMRRACSPGGPSQQLLLFHAPAPQGKRVGVRCGMLGKPAPFGFKSLYKDSPFDRFCIHHLATSLTKATGFTTRLQGYDALTDLSTRIASSKSPKLQRDMALRALGIALPLWMLHIVRNLLRPSKFTWEFYALVTSWFFEWLVGPTEIKETEVNNVVQKSAVHIKKCRFLESSNCVGVCVNMCKIPSEEFIKKELGVDVTMIPNFENMSCEMIFGQKPSSLVEQDPTISQPCYKDLYKEDAKNIHPVDEVFSTPGLNVETSQMDIGCNIFVDSLSNDKEPDPKDENVKNKVFVDMGEESSVNSDKDKEPSKEKSPSLLQTIKMLKRGRKRKTKGVNARGKDKHCPKVPLRSLTNINDGSVCESNI